MLARAAERLRAGEPPLVTAWPEPPEGMVATQVDAAFRAEYLAAMRDRLAQLDEALELGPARESFGGRVSNGARGQGRSGRRR